MFESYTFYLKLRPDEIIHGRIIGRKEKEKRIYPGNPQCLEVGQGRTQQTTPKLVGQGWWRRMGRVWEVIR